MMRGHEKMSNTCKAAKLLIIGFAISLLPGIVMAYPTSISVVPSCGVAEPKTLVLAYEAEGHRQPYDTGYGEYFFSQIGVTDKLEVGVDIYDYNHTSTTYYNAKYLVFSESKEKPGLAAGFMLAGNHSGTLYYAMASRTFNGICCHLGFGAEPGVKKLLLGASYTINDKFSVAADYQSARSGCFTGGVNYSLSNDSSIYLYNTIYNDSDSDDDNYIGLNYSYKLPLQW